jgi:hypothetical protein
MAHPDRIDWGVGGKRDWVWGKTRKKEEDARVDLTVDLLMEVRCGQ